MPTPWVSKVLSTGTLSVAVTDAVTKGLWGPAFADSIALFNSLMISNNIAVQLVMSSAPPDPKGPGGADVLVDVGSGLVKYKTMGKEFSVDIGTHGMTGHTQAIHVQQGVGLKEMVKAFVFVPETFTVMTGRVGNQLSRPVGKSPRTFVLTHELIHCCGLSNADHSSHLIRDIFIPLVNVDGGATPDKDRVIVGESPAVFAPPFKLSSKTAGVIKQNWTP
jgi:hypothetical protein